MGQRNHPRFVRLLMVDSLFVPVATHAAVEATTTVHGLGWAALCFTLVGLGVLMSVMVVGLLAFHLHLVYIGSTTWELTGGSRIAYLAGGRSNRFNFGPLRNLQLFLSPPATWDGGQAGDADEEMVPLCVVASTA